MTPIRAMPRAMTKAIDFRRPAVTINPIVAARRSGAGFILRAGFNRRPFCRTEVGRRLKPAPPMLLSCLDFGQIAVDARDVDRFGEPEPPQDLDQQPGRVELVPGKAVAR